MPSGFLRSFKIVVNDINKEKPIDQKEIYEIYYIRNAKNIK